MLTTSPKKSDNPPTAESKPLLFKPLARAGKRTIVEIYEMMKQCTTMDELKLKFKNAEELAKASRMFEVYKGSNPLFDKLHKAWIASEGIRDQKQIEEEKRAIAIAHAESPFVNETEIKSYLSASERKVVHSFKTGSLGSIHSLGSFSDLKTLILQSEDDTAAEEIEAQDNAPKEAVTLIEQPVTKAPSPPV